MFRRLATRSGPCLVLLASSLAVPGVAFGAEGHPVRFTLVRRHEVRSALELPGTVESRQAAVVAAEAEGLVVALEVEPGEAVEAGATLARLRRVGYEIQLRAAEGRLREAQAGLQLAQSKLRRADELLRDAVISQDEHDDASSGFTAWQARIDQAAAEIDGIQLALDRCQVRAPFRGVVTRKHTEVGEWIQLGGAVVELVSLDRLEVRVEVPERWFARLKRGTRADLTFEALPGYAATGSVREIIPAADPRARTFPVKVGISDPGRRIGVGMLAAVALPVGEPSDSLIVPKDAVVRSGGREVVYRIGDDGTVEAVEVRSVQGAGAWTVVDGPLAEGQPVVTRGNERLFPGQAVAGSPEEYAPP